MAYLMVVDDDSDFADATAMVLRSDGHEVSIELSTESAMRSMKSRRPDLVILDAMFPEDGAAGFKLARDIHNRQDDLKNLNILMLTAVNARFPLGFSARDIDDAWLPVSDFLEKPVDIDVLRGKIESLIQQNK